MFPQSFPKKAMDAIDLEPRPPTKARFGVLAAPPEQPLEIMEDVAMEGRPKGRRGTQQWCSGHAGQLCRFAADGHGGRARGKHDGRCVFCNPEHMSQTTRSAQGRGNVVRLLKRWKGTAPDVCRLACESLAFRGLPEELRQSLQASALEEDQTSKLAQVLPWRRSVAGAPTQAELESYKAGVEADRRYASKKFFPQHLRTVKHAGWQWRNPMSEELRAQVQDVRPNDTGLPAATTSSTAQALEAWCQKASWTLCETCGSVQPQHLKESACRSLPAGTTPKCKNCSKPEAKQTWVPWPEEVPRPLRELPREVILALRPLDIDCGPEWRADYGYYFHSSMVRLSWAEHRVEEKIAGLERRFRRRAEQARYKDTGEAV